MKRRGSLWSSVTSFGNLLAAARKAARGKRRAASVARFEFHLEAELCALQDELLTRTYVPGAYRTFLIYEPKQRLISAAPFRDRVVHHALCSVLDPIFDRCFIHDSYACRRGKGTHAALRRLTQFARRNRYLLKCDILKYFPSIDHEILKSVLRAKVKDRDVLWLADTIIDHSNPQQPVLEWYPGDDLFTPIERRRGLPIGNQTSQFFSNVYLDPFDHFVKEVLKARFYIRYLDDFVILHDDKPWLHRARRLCEDFLAGMRLRLHPQKSVISRTAEGTRFLGFRVFPTHRLLARQNVQRMKRRLRRLRAAFAAGTIAAGDVRQRILSWIGHACHGSTYTLRQRLFQNAPFIRSLG